MKKRTIPVLLLGLACHAGMAQKPQRDTLSLTSKIHQIDEVVVTGARHETDVRHLSQTVSVVGACPDRKCLATVFAARAY